MSKYALIVRVGGTTGGKYYNDYRDGSVLTFNNEKEAEKFAVKIEEGVPGKRAWVEVVEYNPNRKLEDLLSKEFVENIGKRMTRD